MAKSETVPSIVVHSGNANGSSGSEMEQQRPPNRLSRLAKQEEFDLEENYSPSPVTIHIEDGGSGTDENSDANCAWIEGEQLDGDVDESDGELSPTIQMSAGNGTDYLSDGNGTCRRSDKISRSHTQSKSYNKHHQLGKQGSSQGSVDDSSPSLSRDSSTETYTDSTGIDLQHFIIETLHKSQKDRLMLLKIEQELVTLVKDSKCQSYKFPHMSSYNRMLVHRVAAFFGLDHNVDKNGTAVIVNKTKNTRLPDIRFREQIRDELVPDEPKKLILKRDSASFEDGKEKSPERQSSTDSRRSKSFEEREEEYEKARRRIFNKDGLQIFGPQEGYIESPFSRSQDGTLSSSRRSSQEDLRWAGEPRPWSSTDSDSSGWKAGGSFESEGATQNGGKNIFVLSKSDSEAKETLLLNCGARPAVAKASSFGGISVLVRENGKASQKLIKAESFNATPMCTSSVIDDVVVSVEVPSANVTTSPVEINSQCPSAAVEESPPPRPPTPPPPPSPPIPPVCQPSEPPQPAESTIQQVSSQPNLWEVGVGKEVSKVGMANGKTPVWQVPTPVESLPPGSVINPSPVAAPYFNPENVIYRTKSLVTTPTQAFMVTPLQSFTPSPQLHMPLDSPISTSSNPSPPHQSASQHHQQPQQQQQQHSPVSAYHPTIVYIPCVTSQQQVWNPQALQAIPMQQQAQSAMEQRIVNQNGSGQAEVVTQMSQLNFLSQGGIAGNHSIQQMEVAKPPPVSQAYLFPPMKVPTYINQGSAAPQVPVYYVHQVQPGGQNVRYICPTGPIFPPNTTVMSNAPTVDLKKQEMGEARPAQLAPQANPHISGQQLLPQGYSLLTFAQNVDNLNNLSISAMPYFSYAVPSQQPAANPSPANYPYNNILLTGATPPPLLTQPPPSSQPQNLGHHHGGNQVPVCAGGNNPPTPPLPQHNLYPAFRPHTPPSQQGCSPHVPPPFLSYAFYAPHPPPPGSSSHPQQQNQTGQYAPSYMTTGYQVIRPSIPVMGGMKNTTPPPPSPGIIPAQFPTPPPPPHHGKGHFVLQLGKESDLSAVNSHSMSAGACSNSHDQKCPRIPSIHLGPPPPQPVRVPTGLPMYRHGISVMQDMRLLGHPLHHQLNPLLLPQQRPMCRYPHPSAIAQVSLSPHQRTPKLRKQRSKVGGALLGGGGSKNSPCFGGLALEVEGLPEGMKRSDIERYLELVINHGAKIQFHSTDGIVLHGDFIVNSCRHRVVAVFESETAAQSALLNIKTAKFQLRSTQQRGGFAKSIS